jgi:hypothetical protein
MAHLAGAVCGVVRRETRRRCLVETSINFADGTIGRWACYHSHNVQPNHRATHPREGQTERRHRRARRHSGQTERTPAEESLARSGERARLGETVGSDKNGSGEDAEKTKIYPGATGCVRKKNAGVLGGQTEGGKGLKRLHQRRRRPKRFSDRKTFLAKLY